MATPWVQSLSPKKGKKERKKRSLKVFDQLYFLKGGGEYRESSYMIF
jgi:hypothetical protein